MARINYEENNKNISSNLFIWNSQWIYLVKLNAFAELLLIDDLNLASRQKINKWRDNFFWWENLQKSFNKPMVARSCLSSRNRRKAWAKSCCSMHVCWLHHGFSTRNAGSMVDNFSEIGLSNFSIPRIYNRNLRA